MPHTTHLRLRFVSVHHMVSLVTTSQWLPCAAYVRYNRYMAHHKTSSSSEALGWMSGLQQLRGRRGAWCSTPLQRGVP
jgi:hypothetical protein